jgi:hypothetical protein
MGIGTGIVCTKLGAFASFVFSAVFVHNCVQFLHITQPIIARFAPFPAQDSAQTRDVPELLVNSDVCHIAYNFSDDKGK